MIAFKVSGGLPISKTCYYSNNYEGRDKAVELAKKMGVIFRDDPTVPAAPAAEVPAFDAPMEEDVEQAREF